MSYTITTTPGIVIATRARGEANRVLSILTADAGLIEVKVQAMRGIPSKLRYHSQLFSHALFDCVRSREGWRLTGVQGIENKNTGAAGAISIMSRVSFILQHYIQGEESHPELYDWIVHVQNFASQNNEKKKDHDNKIHNQEYIEKDDQMYDQEFFAMLEIVAVARILDLLGYINNENISAVDQLSYETVMGFAPIKSKLVASINAALATSQLS